MVMAVVAGSGSGVGGVWQKAGALAESGGGGGACGWEWVLGYLSLRTWREGKGKRVAYAVDSVRDAERRQE